MTIYKLWYISELTLQSIKPIIGANLRTNKYFVLDGNWIKCGRYCCYSFYKGNLYEAAFQVTSWQCSKTMRNNSRWWYYWCSFIVAVMLRQPYNTDNLTTKITPMIIFRSQSVYTNDASNITDIKWNCHP